MSESTTALPADIPDIPDVLAARRTLLGRVRRTPVLRSDGLDALASARLVCKTECLQITGSFKVRGALNKILSLSAAELARGLVTVSAGNAALGAAHAAREAGARLVVVMPETAVPEKLAAVAALGATIDKDGITSAFQAFARLAELQRAHGYTLVHPFDDAQVIAGAATATWELLEDEPDLDVLAVPASGGGLLAGALLAARALAPRLAVYGIQPVGADGIVRSLAAGVPTAPERISTIADGLTAPKPGEANFALIRRHATGVLTVDDASILAAMAHIVRELKVIVEPAGAAGLAAVLQNPAFGSLRGGESGGAPFRGKRVGIILSGGNAGMERVREALAG